MIARSYKYRLYPSQQQEALLSAWQDACWQVQRLCILQRRIAWRRKKDIGRGPLPNWAGQGREVTALRADDSFLAGVPSDVMGSIVERVHLAYTKAHETFKKTGKFANVRWADSASQVGLQFRGQPDRGTQCVAKTGKYGYWKLASSRKQLGALKVRMHRALPDGVDIRQVHITHAADGWYIAFSCLIPEPIVKECGKRAVVGVDVGCIHDKDTQRIAVTDAGEVYTATDHLKRNAKRLATLQKLVSNRRVQSIKTGIVQREERPLSGGAKHADPNSKRTMKRRTRIARLHQTITRQREHTMQYIAKRITDTATETIVFEKLNLTGMRAKGKGRRKRGLNRSLSTAAPGRLMALVAEKASIARKQVLKVNAAYTSQDCSVCGDRSKKPLTIRAFTCRICGTVHDRDVNAAQNIAKRGIA